jgi:broad specificity phosphatase PhoE
MRLFLVRHGESVGNAERRLQGTLDFDLTELGRKQALLTGERLADAGATAVYASPLVRTFSTAELVAARLGVTPVAVDGVREYDFGELAGATYMELRAHFAAQAGQGDAAVPQERIYPGEEGRESFQRRVSEAIWGIVHRHPDETVAVISHGGPIALFCQTVLGLAYRRPMPFSIDNCSLTVFDVKDEPAVADPGRARLVSLNDTCHLIGD